MNEPFEKDDPGIQSWLSHRGKVLVGWFSTSLSKSQSILLTDNLKWGHQSCRKWLEFAEADKNEVLQAKDREDASSSARLGCPPTPSSEAGT